MESVGRLAGGVAHDFNNILGAIIGYAEFCLLDIDSSHPLFDSISTIKEAGHRAIQLTQQLLAFSRKPMIKKETLNIREEIDNTLKMIGRLFGEDIHITIIHGGTDFLIKADRSQLEQIILNLSINARDAMPDGGQLTIETGTIVFEKTAMNHHFDIDPGEYVRIVISDTEEGIPHGIIGNIFEPFFTTKELGKGTGLALSTIYGIVKQNKGDIDVYSEPGKGTAFKVYLPRVNEHPNGNTISMVKQLTKNRTCTETILLVEDDKMLRKMLYTTLDTLGGGIMSLRRKMGSREKPSLTPMRALSTCWSPMLSCPKRTAWRWQQRLKTSHPI